MKKLIILLLVITFVSCSKEEECKVCKFVTTSNEQEADFKCRNLANNYPDMKVIDEMDLGVLCEDEIKVAKKSETVIINNNWCGLQTTVRLSLKCD